MAFLCTSTIEYNANGGFNAPANTVVQTQCPGPGGGIDYVYVTVSYSTPTRPGYNFAGWKYTQYGTDRYVVGGNEVQFQYSFNGGDQYKTVTLYAQWTPQTYTVSYNVNGGNAGTQPSNQTKTYGVNLTLSSTIPTRQYYNFKGWATSPNGSVVYAAGGTYSANASVTLYAVWELAAAPLTSVSNTEVCSSGTASWTKLDNAHSYKLVLTCGSAPSVTVNSAAGTTSCSFTIPNTWLNYITDSASATATATLTTYNGDTALGSTTMGFTVTVPSSIKPTISSFTASHYSANATVSGWGVFTQGFSCADLSVSATPGTGASIASITFVGPSVNSTGASTTKRTGILGSSGTNTFTVTVADSRGRTATTTVSVNVYPYSAPTILAINTMRADADGTTNNSGGAYLKVQPVYSLSSVNGNNSFTVQTLSYCAHGAGTPVATVTCASGTTYGPPSYMWAINLSDAYDVSVSLTDALGGAVTATVTLPGAAGIWYGKGNDRLGLGSAPSSQGLHVDWDAYFNGVVDVIPRRVSKQITSSGWFRVLEYEAGNTAEAAGAVGFVIDLAIGKDGIGSEAHKVSLYGVYGNVSFKDESSASQTQYIDKIRYTYQTSSPFNAYVDIHLSSNPQSVVTVDFDVSVKPSYQHLFKALALDSVPDAPSGETVLTTYWFAETCTPEARVLLWNNWGTADVAPQTVTIDMTGFRYIDVVFDPFSDLTRIMVQRGLVGPSGSQYYIMALQFFYLESGTGTEALTAVSRILNVYSNKVVIEHGQMLYNNTRYTDWDGRARPIQIWGIR